MKKTILAVITAFFIFAIFSCGNAPVQEEPNTNETETNLEEVTDVDSTEADCCGDREETKD
jgi:hypothetical protein